jgi:stage V sporulation protein G
MKITNVRVYPAMQGTLLAYADITLDNCLSVRELRLLRINGQYVLCMPNVKQTDGTFRDIAYPSDNRTLKIIEKAMIAEYEKVIGPKT